MKINIPGLCFLILISNQGNAVITLKALPKEEVRIQVALDQNPTRALVLGSKDDQCSDLREKNHPSFEMNDFTLSGSLKDNKSLQIYVAQGKELFLAIAGFNGGDRVARSKQIVLPVEDGAVLVVEDNGQGDLSITSIPEIQLINQTNQSLLISLFLKQLAERTQGNLSTKIPWRHELKTTVIKLAKNQTYSFAPQFMFWGNKEIPLLCIIKQFAGKEARISVDRQHLYPLCGRQTIIEFQTNPLKSKALLISAAGILASFEPPRAFNNESDGPFIMVHQGSPWLSITSS